MTYPADNLLTGPHGVVDVDDVVFPGPGVGVAPHPVQVVVLVHGGQHRPVQLQGAEHGGAAGAALATDSIKGETIKTLSSLHEVLVVFWDT